MERMLVQRALILFLVSGLWCLVCSHMPVPTRLWPLTEITGGKEVIWMKDAEKASFLKSTPTYKLGEPGLGYNALSLDDNSVNVTWNMPEKEVNYYEIEKDHPKTKRMLMALFYWDPKVDAEFLNYRSTNGFQIHVYTKAGSVYVAGENGILPVHDIIKFEGLGWYTVAIRWNKGQIKVYFVEAIDGEEKGKKRGEVKAAHLYDRDTVEEPGTLTVGPIPGGAVCCLRWYVDEFDQSHIADYMKENCERQHFWELKVPDACEMKPCQHGGTCGSINARDYSCLCRPLSKGENCETELYVIKQDYVRMGPANLTGKLDPIAGWVNFQAKNARECSCQCIHQNECKSFTFDTQLCTLYDGIVQNYTGNATQYFIERSVIGKV